MSSKDTQVKRIDDSFVNVMEELKLDLSRQRGCNKSDISDIEVSRLLAQDLRNLRLKPKTNFNIW